MAERLTPSEQVLQALAPYLPDQYLESCALRAVTALRAETRAEAMVDVLTYLGVAIKHQPEPAPVHLSQHQRRP